MSDIETDRNLLFAVIALQSELIDTRQFVDGCALWASRKPAALADVLVDQGWLQPEDRQHVEYLLERRLTKKAGDVRSSLAVLSPGVRSMLESIGDPSIHASLQGAVPDPDTEAPIVPRPATIRQDRMILKELHSTGGIGQVWVAFDPVLEREIALKELKADMARVPRNRERFFREAQLTGQLAHPGIVPVYEYFDNETGRCYYTMRFVRGRTLSAVVRQYHDEADTSLGATADLIRLLTLFVDVCRTVAYAHSRNVIHRDLKGDNVIVGNFGEVVVLDWGLGKHLGDASHDQLSDGDPLQTIVPSAEAPDAMFATQQGEKLGTPAYMAPEQARGQIDQIDMQTDVYGLAALLYEILAGCPPFRGASIIEVLDQVIHKRPVPPSELIPGVPKELERICLRGLSKERGERQSSAAEFAAQIECWITTLAERKRTDLERERFFNLSLDLLGILDAQGRLQQTNPAWKTVLGWESSELSGRPVQEILHPDDRHRLTSALERILAGESLTAVEHRCVCRDGSYRWVHWNASLIAGEASIYVVGRDITERKQAEQTFRELLESAPDGMVVVNATGQIVMVNAQIERLFGFPRDQLLGQPIEVLVPAEVRERHPAYVARFVANPDFRPMGTGLALQGCRRDGTLFPAEISLSPVRTEQGLLVSCAVRDMTGRRKAETP